MIWGPCWGPGLLEIYTPVPPFISWIRAKVSNAIFGHHGQEQAQDQREEALRLFSL